MSNPYEDFKQQKGLVKYLCNKCKNQMANFDIDGKEKAMGDIMSILSQKYTTTPIAFYCVNNKCERYGLLTKVAVKK